jgi:hypothetical protein
MPWIIHVSVKMLSCLRGATSNFEVTLGDTVKAKAAIEVTMQTDNTLIDIDAEEHLDRVTAEQLAKIVEFLLNLED